VKYNHFSGVTKISSFVVFWTNVRLYIPSTDHSSDRIHCDGSDNVSTLRVSQHWPMNALDGGATIHVQRLSRRLRRRVLSLH